MPTDLISDTVKRLLTELVLPQLDALRADLRRIEKKLDAPSALRSRDRPRSLSTQGRSYLDAMIAEVNEQTERDAKKWARQKRKDPTTLILPKGGDRREK